MLEAIEKLLILQDRDRRISQLQSELAGIQPERTALEQRHAKTHQQLDADRQKAMRLESDRKKLELEVDAKKQQIERYSLQQFQTKKNDEYRALTQEIESCQADIRKLEDDQLDLMEQVEAAQRQAAQSQQAVRAVENEVVVQMADLAAKEESLRSQLADLEAGYNELMSAVDETALNRYQRLRKHKSGSSVVGIEHSVCGGCHMKLPVQVVIQCKVQRELVSCPNCGRILYWSPHMNIAVAD